MSFGFLPTTRPLAANYGEDLINERPIRNPQLEASADDYNDVRHDTAYLGQVAALARIRITNDGATVAVGAAYGITSGHVTLTRVGAGHVKIEIAPEAVLYASDAIAGCYRVSSTNPWAATEVISTSEVHVYTENSSGAVDCNFLVSIF